MDEIDKAVLKHFKYQISIWMTPNHSTFKLGNLKLKSFNSDTNEMVMRFQLIEKTSQKYKYINIVEAKLDRKKAMFINEPAIIFKTLIYYQQMEPMYGL